MPANDGIKLISLGDLMRELPSESEAAPPGAAVLGKLILQGDVVVIRGKEAEAMSFVATCLGLMIAGGRKRNGNMGATKRRTVYLDGHNASHDVRHRLSRLLPNKGPLWDGVQKTFRLVLPSAQPRRKVF